MKIATETAPAPLPAARDLRKSVSSAYESTPSRLLRWAAIDWLIILLTWFAMSRTDLLIVTLPGILIVATRLHALGALLHDACHSRVRSSAWPLVEAVAGWPIASTIAAMRYHHLRHHWYSGTRHDPYRNRWTDRGPVWRAVLVLRGALLPLWWTLRAVVSPIAAVNTAVRRFYTRAFLQDRSDTNQSESDEIKECIRADFRQLAAQITLLAAALLTGFPLLEYYIFPWIIAGVSNAQRVLYEHSFESSTDSSRETVYVATVDHNAGRVFNKLVYPHNLGFHRAHHLYPTASFVHLPWLTEAVQQSQR